MKKPSVLPILYTGPQFRIIRNQAGLSINRLWKMSGVSRTQIIKFENEVKDENGKKYSILCSTYRKLIDAVAQFNAEKQQPNND